MDALEKKFKAYGKELGMSESITLKELVKMQSNFGEYDTYLQYLGFSDFKKRELYEGDIIELLITAELMDRQKNSFYNSNLGKHITEIGNITSVICVIEPNSTTLSCGYRLYCLQNGKILRDSRGELDADAIAREDSMFPQYLSNKGATWIGNILESPDLLQNRGESWLFPDIAYVTLNNEAELRELVDAFGIENICSPYINGTSDEFIAEDGDPIHVTYKGGYVHCLIDKERPDCLQMIHWMKCNGNYPRIEFSEFKYSDLWEQTVPRIESCRKLVSQ